MSEIPQGKSPGLISPKITELRGRKWVPVLVIILVLAGVYFSLAKHKYWWPFVSQSVDTTGMARFWDNRYQFQFYYPKELIIVDEGPDQYEQDIINGKTISGTQPALLDNFKIGGGSDQIIIQVPENKVFPVYANEKWNLRACGQDGFRTINSQKKIIFAGRETLDLISTSVKGDISRYYCVNNLKNQPLIIIFNPDSIIAKKVLATFSFFEPIPSPTPDTTWKIFKDEAKGFEIQYPEFAFFDLYPPADGPANRVFGVNGVGQKNIFYFSIYALPLRPNAVPCSEAAQNFTQPFRFEGGLNIDGTDYQKCLITKKLTDVSGVSVVDEEVLHISFNKNGYTWQFLATNYDKLEVKEAVDGMISTFKFIK